MHFSTGWPNDNRLWKMMNSRFPRAPVDTAHCALPWISAAFISHMHLSHRILHGDLIYVCIDSPAGESRVHRVESRIAVLFRRYYDFASDYARIHCDLCTDGSVYSVLRVITPHDELRAEISTDWEKMRYIYVKNKQLAMMIEKSSNRY